jgi:SAM-dependent methyltransferase
MRRVKLERLRYVGRRVNCPLCGGRFRSFAPDLWDGRRWHGAPSRCPACSSLSRHRFLWLYLTERLGLDGDASLLHVAPEAVIAERLHERVGNYVSTDIEPGRADVEADLTALPFVDESFDLVVCSHVLEHVSDDRAAMRELNRVLRPGGVALIQTPVNYDQAGTYEDPGASDPEDRLRRFSQSDHVRVFGPDLRERLEGAGFAVTVEDAADLGAETVTRYGLHPNATPLRNDLYRCER